LRASLLGAARYRCCLHRRLWLRRVPYEHSLIKHEVLDVHHVKFRSIGGSDLPENLVPLCPTCHRMLHQAARAGAPLISDVDLREAWKQWKAFSQVVPAALMLDGTESPPMATISLDLYGLTSQVSFDSDTAYATFRELLLERTVVALRAADPDFPFARNVADGQWSLSCDSHATRGQWDTQRALHVLAKHQGSITFLAPVVIQLDDRENWFMSTRPEHRGL
jgi:hypothetical protein